MGTYGDGGNAVVLRQRLRLRGYRRRDRRDHAGRSGARLAGPLHPRRRRGLRAAAGHQAPDPVPRAAAGGRARGARCWRSARPSRCSATGTRRRRASASTASAMLDVTTSPQPKRTIGEVVSQPLLRRADPARSPASKTTAAERFSGPPPSRWPASSAARATAPATASTARCRAASSPPTCTARAWPATRSSPTCCCRGWSASSRRWSCAEVDALRRERLAAPRRA